LRGPLDILTKNKERITEIRGGEERDNDFSLRKR
jgi:hypothetical protein